MSDNELKLGFPGDTQTFEGKLPEPNPWDLDTKLAVVGKAEPRLDAVDKVTGRARYSFDRRFPNMVYARFLGAAHARAKVTSVDLSAAKAVQGVVHVEDLTQRGRWASNIFYAGQPVAGIAAETEEALDDALARVEVEYQVLPHVTSTDEAMQPKAPSAIAGANVRRGRPRGDMRAVKAAHDAADVVLRREYRTQVQTHSCLESHGSVMVWDGQKLTVYASTQATFNTQRGMARALRLSPKQVEVVTEHMGGGFGSKFGPDAWDVFCARVAMKTQRPCRYLLDRKEEHLAGNRPDSIQTCTFSVKKDGTLMGAEVRAHGTAGIASRGAGVANPTIYRFKATWSDQATVLTNASRARAFRAPRHPQGVFALEGMLDELAEAIGMDPLALRKKNDPHRVRRAQYDVGAKAIGWERRVKSGSHPGPKKRGLGMASATWKHNARPFCAIRCRIGKDGSVLLASGAQDIGTGTRTVIAMVGAEELGITTKDVEVRIGHTSDPYGHASGGSVTTPSISPAARAAAYEAKQKLLEGVAARLGGEAKGLDLQGGKVVGAGKPLTFKQACALLTVDAVEATATIAMKDMRLPRFEQTVGGVQFAEVEVDVELGSVRVIKVVAVQDCGLVVNPLTARNQINGAVIQGISYALFEERLMDPGTGRQLNADLLNYKVLGAADMPEIVSIPFSVANGITNTGASSLGEPPTVPTSGAIANAVANAIGARIRSLPITPDKVLAALADQEKKKK